jgi:hypothetical protein
MASLLKPVFLAPSLAVSLVACATPKATPVATPPLVVKTEEKKELMGPPLNTVFPTIPDDGIRMPDMLTMPSDNDFRPTFRDPSTGVGPIISRPPMDPPERVKPQPQPETGP